MSKDLRANISKAKGASFWGILLATWFYCGRLSKAPGTIGTIGAIPLCLALHFLGPFWQMGASLFLFPVAVWASDQYDRFTGGHDSSEIVIDEVLGFIITMTWLPMTWQSYVFGFVLFRCLDILKPFPISYLDKNLKGGVGVVADDVLAGVIASVLLQMIYVKTAWLGLQLGVLQ